MIATLACRLAGGGSVEADLEARLWQGARRGDERALEELVRRHQGRVYNLAYRMLRSAEEAEDVTQDAFLRALAALPRLRDERAFAPWLLRITANLCITRLRKRVRNPEEALEAADVPAPEEDTLARLELEKALARLPVRYRLALTTFYVEGRSYREAAELVGVPVTTFRTQLYRAREMLRQALGRPEERR